MISLQVKNGELDDLKTAFETQVSKVQKWQVKISNFSSLMKEKEKRNNPNLIRSDDLGFEFRINQNETFLRVFPEHSNQSRDKWTYIAPLRG